MSATRDYGIEAMRLMVEASEQMDHGKSAAMDSALIKIRLLRERARDKRVAGYEREPGEDDNF